jgi:NDP-sugar pyrophosphorylase family protein
MKAVLRLPQAAPGLHPLTLTASPAMVPLLGAPLIEPLLAQLARTGVTEITLLHECFCTEVSEYFRDGRRLGVLLSHVSVDPGPT